MRRRALRAAKAPTAPAPAPKSSGGVWRGVLTGLASLLLLGYVGYQAYHALYHSVTTQRVYSATVRDSLTTDGFVLRHETVLTSDIGTGVLNYACSDGERVAKNGTVAEVYSSAQDAANASRLAKLKSEIGELSGAGSASDASAADVSMLDERIDDSLLSVAELAASPSGLDGLDQVRSNLLSLLNRKQLATGEATDFSARIAQLQQQVGALGSSKGAVRAIASPESGYFVSSIDGYESAYDTDKVLSISTADIQQLTSRKPQKAASAVGKVISDYDWYIVCTVPSTQARRLKVGASAAVQFMLSSEGEVPVTVAAVNRAGDTSAVVLQCGVMTDKLAVIRRQTVQIVISEITGVKVPNSVIHVVRNVKGVYVRNGNTIQFKTIQPLYSGNGFTISTSDPTSDSLLQVYDEAIVKGDDLYDGKIVQ